VFAKEERSNEHSIEERGIDGIALGVMHIYSADTRDDEKASRRDWAKEWL